MCVQEPELSTDKHTHTQKHGSYQAFTFQGKCHHSFLQEEGTFGPVQLITVQLFSVQVCHVK